MNYNNRSSILLVDLRMSAEHLSPERENTAFAYQLYERVTVDINNFAEKGPCAGHLNFWDFHTFYIKTDCSLLKHSAGNLLSASCDIPA